VDEIILLHLQVLGEDIVCTYLDMEREGNTVQQAWIEVRCHYLPRWADTLPFDILRGDSGYILSLPA
jgi:uncharacterized membrane protein YhdT